METKDQLNLLKWRSRRGILELDQLLVPFAATELKQLNNSKKKLFATLLSLEDPVIYSYFFYGIDNIENTELRQLVREIVAFYQK